MLGLEEGSLPRRGAQLAVPRRRRAAASSARGSSAPTRSAATATSSTPRARAPTRRLYLVREAATDDGAPREPSPFWDEVAARLRPPTTSRARRRGGRSPRSRWPLEEAPTERERLRALAPLSVATDADRGARARRRERLGAPARRARARVRPRRRGSRNPRRARVRSARRTTFGVTELERFADCSSAWLVRARRRPEDDRRRGRRDAARLGRAPGAVHVLRRAAEGARRRPRRRRRTLERGARASSRRCLDDALRGGVRLELDRRRSAAELDEGALARPRALRARRGAVAARARAAPLRGRRSAPSARRPSCSAASTLGDGLLPQRQDRPHRRRPVQRARDRAGLQVGQGRALGDADRRGAAAPDPALHARAARPRRDRAARRRLPRARRRARRARPAARRRAPTTCRASRRTTTSTTTRSGRIVETARERARGYAQRIRAGDVEHDPKGGDVPVLVRPLDDVPGASARERASRRAAVEATGEVFVSAGAGTGKTTRARRAVRARGLRRGLDVESVLVITYTRKAAGELRARIRAALHARGRARPRARARRRVDLDHPRLLLAAAARAPVRGRARPALPRARRRSRRRAPRRGVRARARGVLRARATRSGCGCSRPTARSGCAGC